MIRRSLTSLKMSAGAAPHTKATPHFKAAMSSILHPPRQVASAAGRWVDIDTSFVDISDDYEEPRHHRIKELLTAPDEPHMQRFLGTGQRGDGEGDASGLIQITQERRLDVAHELIAQCKEYVLLDRDGMIDGHNRVQEINSGPHYEDVDRRSKRRRMWYGIREAFETCRDVVWVCDAATGLPAEQPVPVELLYECTAWYQSAEAMRVEQRLAYENTASHWYEEIDMTRETECLMRAIRDGNGGKFLTLPMWEDERSMTLSSRGAEDGSSSNADGTHSPSRNIRFTPDEVDAQRAERKAQSTETTSRIMRCYTLCKKWNVPFHWQKSSSVGGGGENAIVANSSSISNDTTTSTYRGLLGAIGQVSATMSSWQALSLIRTISDDTAAFAAIFAAAVPTTTTTTTKKNSKAKKTKKKKGSDVVLNDADELGLVPACTAEVAQLVALFEAASKQLDTYLEDDVNALLKSCVEVRDACPELSTLLPPPTATKDSSSSSSRKKEEVYELKEGAPASLDARLRVVESLVLGRCRTLLYQHGVQVAAEDGLVPGADFMKVLGQQQQGLDSGTAGLRDQDRQQMVLHKKHHGRWAEGQVQAKRHSGTASKLAQTMADLRELNQKNKKTSSSSTAGNSSSSTSGSSSGRNASLLQDLVNNVGTTMSSSGGTTDITSVVRSLGLPEGVLNSASRAPQLLGGLDTVVGRELSTISSLKDLLVIAKGFAAAYFVPKSLVSIELHALKLSMGDETSKSRSGNTTATTAQQKYSQIAEMLVALSRLGSSGALTYECGTTTMLDFYDELVELEAFADDEERAAHLVVLLRAVEAMPLPAAQKTIFTALQFMEEEASMLVGGGGEGKQLPIAAWAAPLIEHDAVTTAAAYAKAATQLANVGATPEDIDSWERVANTAISAAVKDAKGVAAGGVPMSSGSKVVLIRAVVQMLQADRLALSAAEIKAFITDVVDTVLVNGNSAASHPSSLTFRELVELNCTGLLLSTPTITAAAKLTAGSSHEQKVLVAVDAWQEQLWQRMKRRRSADRDAAVAVVSVVDGLRGQELSLREDLQQLLVHRLE